MVLGVLALVVTSLLGTFSAMALAGISLKLPTEALTPFIAMASIGDAVHLFSLIRYRLSQSDCPADSLGTVLYQTVEKIRIPCLLTSVTTGIGFLSFLAAEIRPVGELGLFAELGTALAFSGTFVLLPAWLGLCRKRLLRPQSGPEGQPVFGLFLAALHRFTFRHSRAVLLTGSVLVLISAVGISRLSFRHNSLSWFPNSDPVKRAVRTVDEQFSGTVSLDLVINSSGREQDPAVTRPELLVETAAVCNRSPKMK